jgi:hypothetical protein
MSKLVVTNIETQNIKFDSDTTAFTIASDGTVSGTGDNATMVLLRKITASSVSSIEFIHGSNGVVLDSTYSRYEITIDTMIPANAQNLRVYGSSNGGSSYYGDSTYNTMVHRSYTNGSSTATDINYHNDSLATTLSTIPFAANKGGVDGKIVVTNLGTAHRTLFNTEFWYFDTSSYYTNVNCIGAVESNGDAFNAIKIAMTSGNIASGTFKLYGIK